MPSKGTGSGFLAAGECELARTETKTKKTNISYVTILLITSLTRIFFSLLAHLDFIVGSRLDFHNYPIVYFDITFYQCLSNFLMLFTEAKKGLMFIIYQCHFPMKNRTVINTVHT